MLPSEVERPFELVANHCDIADRLDAVPPSARIRGLFFQSIRASVERRGLASDFDRLFAGKRYRSTAWYPLHDYLVWQACAGALVASPERVHEGMHQVMHSASSYFAESLLGRVLIRLLSNDPVRLSEQGLAARRQTSAYGHWELVRHGPRKVEMVYRNEYQWLESAVAGAAAGTFAACGLSPVLKTTLWDRFNGSTLITW